MSSIKNIAKRLIKMMTKKVIIIVSAVVIAIALISAIIYYITLDDGSYRDGDKTSTPYAVEKFSDDVIIYEDGSIQTVMSTQELWDKMIEDGCRVKEYLDKPEELKKLINAQLLTNNLDTRSDPTQKINWDKINEDVNSKDVQGIIKLKRSDQNGNVSLLTYTDPQTFQSYIDEYNKTGSQEAKNNAMKHFTIEKGYSSAGGGNYKTGTDGTAKKIEKGDTIQIPQGQGYGTTYTYNSWQLIGAGTQLKLREQAGMTFDKEGFGRINGRYAVAVTPKFGAVGDYIDYYYKDDSGNEKMIPCIICDVKGSDAQNEWGHHGGANIIEFYVNEETWCTPNWMGRNIRKSKLNACKPSNRWFSHGMERRSNQNSKWWKLF